MGEAEHLDQPITPGTPSLAERCAAAHAFYDRLGLAEVAAYDPNIQDSEGLVSYCTFIAHPSQGIDSSSLRDPPVEGPRHQLAAILEGLGSCIVSALLKLTGDDAADKHDPGTWIYAAGPIIDLVCSNFRDLQMPFDEMILGTDPAEKFLTTMTLGHPMLGADLRSFQDFLEQQGRIIRETDGGPSLVPLCRPGDPNGSLRRPRRHLDFLGELLLLLHQVRSEITRADLCMLFHRSSPSSAGPACYQVLLRCREMEDGSGVSLQCSAIRRQVPEDQHRGFDELLRRNSRYVMDSQPPGFGVDPRFQHPFGLLEGTEPRRRAMLRPCSLGPRWLSGACGH